MNYQRGIVALIEIQRNGKEMINMSKKMCDLICHKHGQKLNRGMSECMGRRVEGMHLFDGPEILFNGWGLVPYYNCIRCHAAVATYRCDGDTI